VFGFILQRTLMTIADQSTINIEVQRRRKLKSSQFDVGQKAQVKVEALGEKEIGARGDDDTPAGLR